MGKLQPGEYLSHRFSRNRHADDLLRAGNAHAYRFSFGELRHQVHHGARLATADVEHQARRTLDTLDIVIEVHAALEAMRGVAGEVVAPGAPGNRCGVKERRFQENVARRLRRLGALSPHDAAETNDTRVIADAQHRGIDFDLLLV